MLVSFFPNYRGCVHRGENFSTTKENENDEVEYKRYEKLHELYGVRIKNTSEYFRIYFIE